jgi:hypothetical protein
VVNMFPIVGFCGDAFHTWTGILIESFLHL